MTSTGFGIRATVRPFLISVALFAFSSHPLTATASLVPPAQPQATAAWSFGVIADTQWTKADDGYNPNTVAANIIKQVDQRFISHGVKFVVAVGDTMDIGSKVSIDTRALYAQNLYNAGIGFYPLRGNHEAAEDPNYLDSGPDLRYAFPQIQDGVNNNTPLSITTAIITATDLISNPPAVRTGSPFTIGTNFSEPTTVNAANKSVSYAFRYGNATFALLDQFDVNGDYYNSTIPDQLPWISQTLQNRPAGTHAFVFSHKNLLGGNHKDNLFGGPITTTDPGDGYGVVTSTLSAAEQITLSAKQAAMNDFIGVLQATMVDYLVTGHDHHHYASVVTSLDGRSKVRQLITQSDSSKFYIPKLPVSANDVPVQQDLNRVGYYIFTVDGPRVTIDYYGDTTGGGYYGVNGGQFHFVKMSSISYSLNGKEKLVAQGGSYALSDNTTVAASLESGFVGTSMTVITGTNVSTATTNYAKPIVNNVTTGWRAAEAGLVSDILILNGMAKTLGGAITDQYVLSMSYVPGSTRRPQDMLKAFILVTRNASGGWVNAVAQNSGGSAQFVRGPWNASYGLGTHGFDETTQTVWAVLNHSGEFSVRQLSSVILPIVFRY